MAVHSTWRFREGDIEAQTRQTLENLDRVLQGFDVTKSNLAYIEIYLTNAQEHTEPVIRLLKEYMGQHRPAGSLIGVKLLGIPGATDRNQRRRTHGLRGK
ncbi:enamine deaminase RidA (YjgF/YER057c/UK114 family) [Bacillus thermophilus]|uniref:Enamine deaminase RidA (YjgF/YER057c/UK114 family) n=1 Tax=Siminovitchia thermophila TaxID=1245522 RepID=A0ABS2R5U2_9BACI|nr:enamine deaminase RidA (YjgF/YER057c/UK114 family) [Siminovitchia thermophila]